MCQTIDIIVAKVMEAEARQAHPGKDAFELAVHIVVLDKVPHLICKNEIVPVVPRLARGQTLFILPHPLTVKYVHYKLGGNDLAGLVVFGSRELVAAHFMPEELKLPSDGNAPVFKIHIVP